MRESDLIRAMWEHFPRSLKQQNRLFHTDAEIVTIGDMRWAITMDEFSDEEDGFGPLDTPTLGHNLVAAVVSDLVAVGATPQFFMHSLTLPPGTESIETFCSSISETLQQVGAFLIGGDIGQAPAWRYTGVALGPVLASRPLTREIPVVEQDLWVTGKLGAANLAMFEGRPTPRLTLHTTGVQRFLSRHATACIDTSGGLVDALWCMHEMSPGIRLEVDLSAIPYDPAVVDHAASRDLPLPAFLFGGAGEYELLFTAPADLACEIDATRIGRVLPHEEDGIWLVQGDRSMPLSEAPPCPREHADRDDYIRAVLVSVEKALS